MKIILKVERLAMVVATVSPIFSLAYHPSAFLSLLYVERMETGRSQETPTV